jgi:hypothetical protein
VETYKIYILEKIGEAPAAELLKDIFGRGHKTSLRSSPPDSPSQLTYPPLRRSTALQGVLPPKAVLEERQRGALGKGVPGSGRHVSFSEMHALHLAPII